MSIANRLADQFAQHDVNLARLEAHHSQKILKMLKKLENDLLGKIAKTADGNAPFTAARSQALLKLTRASINHHYELIAKENRGQLADLARYELDSTATIMNKTIGVKLLSVGVPDSVINSMLKEDTAVGVPLKSFWQQQSTNLRNRFTEQVRAGTFAGETMGQMVQRIRGTRAKGFKDGVMQASRSGAEVVVRTASQSILNDARMEVYEANSDVIGGMQVQSTLDGRTSEICIARSRAAWDLEGNPLPGTDTEENFPGPPPWHVNCLPGDTRVSSCAPVTAKSQRWYEGDVVIMHTAAGYQLTCTPNHPVLTGQGWLSSHLLQEGNDVIRSLRTEWEIGRRRVDNNNMAVRIEDMPVSALDGRLLTYEVPVTTKDFHGDVVVPQIAVITTNCKLRRQDEPTINQQLPQMNFSLRTKRTSRSLTALCNALSLTRFACLFASRDVGRMRKGLSLQHSHACMSHHHSLIACANFVADCFQPSYNQHTADVERRANRHDTLAGVVASSTLRNRKRNITTTRFDTGFVKDSPYTSKTDVELARQILTGQTGPITFDKIVRIEHKTFHGFVYNLQTTNEFYMANSIIVHNCRTTLIPIVKSIDEILGTKGVDKKLAKGISKSTQASMDGQVAGTLNYEDWLKTKPEAFQKEVLGQGKFDLWKAGKIGLRDLIDQRGRPVSLKELRKDA